MQSSDVTGTSSTLKLRSSHSKMRPSRRSGGITAPAATAAGTPLSGPTTPTTTTTANRTKSKTVRSASDTEGEKESGVRRHSSSSSHSSARRMEQSLRIAESIATTGGMHTCVLNISMVVSVATAVVQHTLRSFSPSTLVVRRVSRHSHRGMSVDGQSVVSGSRIDDSMDALSVGSRHSRSSSLRSHGNSSSYRDHNGGTSSSGAAAADTSLVSTTRYSHRRHRSTSSEQRRQQQEQHQRQQSEGDGGAALSSLSPAADGTRSSRRSSRHGASTHRRASSAEVRPSARRSLSLLAPASNVTAEAATGAATTDPSSRAAGAEGSEGKSGKRRSRSDESRQSGAATKRPLSSSGRTHGSGGGGSRSRSSQSDHGGTRTGGLTSTSAPSSQAPSSANSSFDRISHGGLAGILAHTSGGGGVDGSTGGGSGGLGGHALPPRQMIGKPPLSGGRLPPPPSSGTLPLSPRAAATVARDREERHRKRREERQQTGTSKGDGDDSATGDRASDAGSRTSSRHRRHHSSSRSERGDGRHYEGRREQKDRRPLWQRLRTHNVTQPAYLLAHILRATPVVALHFACELSRQVVALPMLRFKDESKSADTVLPPASPSQSFSRAANADVATAALFPTAAFAGSFILLRTVLQMCHRYMEEALFLDNSLVVRNLRSRRVSRRVTGWILRLASHAAFDPVFLSVLSPLLCLRVSDLSIGSAQVKYTLPGLARGLALGCTASLMERVVAPSVTQLVNSAFVTVCETTEYVLMRRYRMDWSDEDEEAEDSEDEDEEADMNDIDDDLDGVSEAGSRSSAAAAGGTHRSRVRSHSHRDGKPSRSPSSTHGKDSEAKKGKDESDHRSSPTSKHRTHSSSSHKSHDCSKSAEVSAGTANATTTPGGAGAASPGKSQDGEPSNATTRETTAAAEATIASVAAARDGRNLEREARRQVRAERKAKRERRQRRKTRQERRAAAARHAVLRAIGYRVGGGLLSQCLVGHPMAITVELLRGRAVMHAAGMLSAYDDISPNDASTAVYMASWTNVKALVHALVRSGNSTTPAGMTSATGNAEDNVSVPLAVRILRSAGADAGHEVQMLSNTVLTASGQTAPLDSLTQRVAEKIKEGGRPSAWESAELMGRSLLSLTPLYYGVQFTALDKLLGFYMAVWTRLTRQ